MSESTRFRYNQEAGNYYEELKENRFKQLHEDEKKRARIIYTIAFAKGIESLPLNFEWKSLPGEKKDIRLEVFESIATDAIIRQKFGVEKLEPEFKLNVYRSAIERGLLLLKQEEQEDNEQFFLSLLDHNVKKEITTELNKTHKQFHKLDVPTPLTVIPLSLSLGHDDFGNPVEIVFNSKEHNQFIGVSGKSGSGKTQFVKDLIVQLTDAAPDLSIVSFDLGKGDIANDGDFVNATNLNVIDVQKDGLPYNPFILEDPSRKKIDELKDILVSIQPKLGTAQSQSLYSYLEEIYNQTTQVDVNLVNQFIQAKYQELGIKADSLTNLLHVMSIHELFPDKDRHDTFNTLYDKHVIFDLHKIDSKIKIKELIMFFILHKIYKEARSMNEAKEDPTTGMREIRAVIILDEAHNYLNVNNNILEKMLRELRSKGIGIIIMTQGYGDYEQKNFDYSSQMNWTFLLKSDNTRKAIEKALGVSKNVSEDLRQSITHAEAGKIYARKFQDEDNQYNVFNARQFYHRNQP